MGVLRIGETLRAKDAEDRRQRYVAAKKLLLCISIFMKKSPEIFVYGVQKIANSEEHPGTPPETRFKLTPVSDKLKLYCKSWNGGSFLYRETHLKFAKPFIFQQH